MSTASNQAVITWVERITRVGWLAKGFVFVVIGALAAVIASNRWSTDAETSADQQGALRTIAAQPLGSLLLVALAIGLALFCAWKVTLAVAPGAEDINLFGIAKRVGSFGLGAFYGALAFAAVRLAFRGDGSSSAEGTSSSEASPSQLTARLMDATGGRWLVGAVASAVFAIAGYHAWKGASARFLDDIDTDDLGQRRQAVLRRFGIVGFLVRSLVLALTGWFLLKAAIQFDPDEAVGLDGVLRELAELTYGRALLFGVGAGLMIAGGYDMITFRRQKIG